MLNDCVQNTVERDDLAKYLFDERINKYVKGSCDNPTELKLFVKIVLSSFVLRYNEYVRSFLSESDSNQPTCD